MDWTWIITPVAGGVIGYFTNVVAIKMLFRPHYEKRLFGIKLPFTPGLIPKEKHRLAQKMGETLAKNVLTEDELVEAVSSPAVMDKLVSLLDGFLESFKSGAYDGQIGDLCDVLSQKIAAALEDSQSPVNTAFTGVIERIAQTGLVHKIINALRSNTHILGDYTPDGLPERLMAFISSKSPDLVVFLKALPERYPDVDEKIKNMVQKIAEENFGSFLGIFIKYDQLYDKIKESVFGWLEDPDNTRFMAYKTAAAVDMLLRRQIGELAGKIPEDTLDGIAARISEKADNINPSEFILRFIPEPRPVVKGLLKGSVKAITSGLNDENSAKLNDYAIRALRLIASKGGAFVVSSIRFDELVENKINAFSVAEAEDLILSVVDKELKLITALGGILGFFIGFIPLLTRFFGV
ncbi:MAG: DUF445 family protein [Defluviitaleaceae bacterium]|nr:DUF445 family protein [Defluviitaleaceae bacterium]MCL2835770.1 DUF445 family protein [Defluviitaleaceae bacterium]